ncbi:MAG: hypothetical protein KIS66_07180 [Fimbriimonadaceae bacterium]|nr:hypothetical protein [Fimbriimonadaceae bacterium]
MPQPDVFDSRPDIVMRGIACLGVGVRNVPTTVVREIADALDDHRDYTEQVRWALIARGYLPKPEKKT